MGFSLKLEQIEQIEPSVLHFPGLSEDKKQKRCQECGNKTIHICKLCTETEKKEVGLHVTECFEKFHVKKLKNK
jgi:hypothetical protein